MIAPRKQKIVGVVVTVTLVSAAAALLVYRFATGSPDALPLLLNIVGGAAGITLVYSVDYALLRGLSASRWVRGVVLAGLCAVGFLAQTAVPLDGASYEALQWGLGSGVGFSAFLQLFFGVLFPPEDSMKEWR